MFQRLLESARHRDVRPRSRSWARGFRLVLLLLVKDLVDEAVFFGLSRPHVEIAIDVLGHLVAGAAEEDDPVLQQPAEDVPGSLATVRCLNDVGIDDGAARPLEDGDGLCSGLGSLHDRCSEFMTQQSWTWIR